MSPFPGMDPFLEKKPFFEELHTQILAAAQGRLQPQLRPKYVARLEGHLSEGSVWDPTPETVTLHREETAINVAAVLEGAAPEGSTAALASPSVSLTQELDEDELQLRRQRRIVIYVQTRPRQAVASI